jgi:hypothetical protein
MRSGRAVRVVIVDDVVVVYLVSFARSCDIVDPKRLRRVLATDESRRSSNLDDAFPGRQPYGR